MLIKLGYHVYVIFIAVACYINDNGCTRIFHEIQVILNEVIDAGVLKSDGIKHA